MPLVISKPSWVGDHHGEKSFGYILKNANVGWSCMFVCKSQVLVLPVCFPS